LKISNFPWKPTKNTQIHVLSNYWDTRNPLFTVHLKGLWSNKMWREKFVLAENVPFHPLKLVLPWRNKQRVAAQNLELRWKFHHNTFKKKLTKMRVQRKAKNSAARATMLSTNLSKNTTKRRTSCSGLNWRLYTTQKIRWPDQKRLKKS
jgi:hypothetical protein